MPFVTAPWSRSRYGQLASLTLYNRSCAPILLSALFAAVISHRQTLTPAKGPRSLRVDAFVHHPVGLILHDEMHKATRGRGAHALRQLMQQMSLADS